MAIGREWGVMVQKGLSRQARQGRGLEGGRERVRPHG